MTSLVIWGRSCLGLDYSKVQTLAVSFDFSPLQARPVQNKIDSNPTLLHESFPMVNCVVMPGGSCGPAAVASVGGRRFPHSAVASVEFN